MRHFAGIACGVAPRLARASAHVATFIEREREREMSKMREIRITCSERASALIGMSVCV